MADRWLPPVRPRVVAWVGVAAASLGWGAWAGAVALGPVPVPGPTVTVTATRTATVAAEPAAPSGWTMDPGHPWPGGIPDGRHLVSDLVPGTYDGIARSPGQACNWRREGPPDPRTGLGALVDEGRTLDTTFVTIRGSDHWFVTEGCQWHRRDDDGRAP